MSVLPTTPSFRLDGRKALVTGAGRGIGLAAAVALAEAGAHVVLAARSRDEIEAGAEALRAKGLKRVALLGTRFTLESRMFGSLGDIGVVMPPPAEIERINAIYMDVVAGRGSPAQLDELREMARTFIARDGAEAVLIAGTDLSPVLTPDNAGFPAIDCAAIHIDAIMRRLTA